MTIEIIVAVVIFLIGIALSAFFSGSETGFYRLSPLRLAVDAGTGDAVARRLLMLTQHADRFVATTLVGNNIANYLTTLAIGLFSAAIFTSSSGFTEVLTTWMTAPIIFVAGELLPKILYFQAPLHFLRPGSALFLLFYYLFLPLSIPLTFLSRLMERLTRSRNRKHEVVLARSRFGQFLTTGHREGLLGNLQSRLLQNLLASSLDRVSGSVTPPDRIYDIEETASHEEVLQHAKRFGLTEVLFRKKGKTARDGCVGYINVAELQAADSLKAALRPLLRIYAHKTKLAALIELREEDHVLGAVYDGDTFLGIVKERGLISQFLRNSPSSKAASFAADIE
ncbi:CNNM domain-containing protein [Calycomorphotria hydatis]|uniref:CNNM transmembrane domain-containing protein n=1 Tax=Calycomorphotria hydatis TaxID=2528027 RepID=A0A517TCE7_9PLAN|nr:CNNM domain-containing protein [Calycomorphotria hydatis]QDT66049.1 hypothetical protein V22_33130 [Calycomorphotria hydatis]